MKVGVVSDTHMMKQFIDNTIPYLKECDLIIHAGDNFSDSKYIHNVTNVGVMAVRGNCDFDDVEDELVFEVENKTIFLCHGDRYGVKYGIDRLETKAKEINANIVVFGHTHIPLCIEKDGVLYLNPGSVSLPRQVTYKSFVTLDIEDEKIQI
ncbi:metallophosphoesterase, partial [Romboutsia sp.]|uniref:metallophosphoesterase n=1 Tax=Romboutsia sp. TaxID=1965302 RepID=UPI002BCADD07